VRESHSPCKYESDHVPSRIRSGQPPGDVTRRYSTLRKKYVPSSISEEEKFSMFASLLKSCLNIRVSLVSSHPIRLIQ
jgi:hypothetical protein